MSHWILGLLILGLVALAVRQFMGWGHHGFAIPVIVVLALVLGFFVWRQERLESTLTAAVRELVGDPMIDVHCQGFLREFRLDNNLGEVSVDRNGEMSSTAQLRGSVCSELRSWLASDRADPSREQVVAVHVLAHEAVHASGIRDEGHTECLAMQHDEELALLLGASSTQAIELADRYWREVFPRMPGRYRPVECRPDAMLDESPGDGHWPGSVQLAAPTGP